METALQVTARRARIEDLYSAHGRDATHLAYLLTGSRAEAEDLAQEAFVRLLGKFGDLRNPDAFRSYLFRTVVNLSKGGHRRRATEQRYQARVAAMSTTTVTGDVDIHDDLWRALAELPERQRVALVLRYCEDLSLQQTAEVMRTSAKAVKSLVTRGLAALREQEVSFR
jgi:RNA polymerase sigma factor (sigma-70 family)